MSERKYDAIRVWPKTGRKLRVLTRLLRKQIVVYMDERVDQDLRDAGAEDWIDKIEGMEEQEDD